MTMTRCLPPARSKQVGRVDPVLEPSLLQPSLQRQPARMRTTTHRNLLVSGLDTFMNFWRACTEVHHLLEDAGCESGGRYCAQRVLFWKYKYTFRSKVYDRPSCSG